MHFEFGDIACMFIVLIGEWGNTLCIYTWSRYWKSKKIANGIQGQGLRLSPIRIQDNPQSAVFKVTQDKGGIGRAQADF